MTSYAGAAGSHEKPGEARGAQEKSGGPGGAKTIGPSLPCHRPFFVRLPEFIKDRGALKGMVLRGLLCDTPLESVARRNSW